MVSKIEKNQRQVTDYEFALFCKCLNVTPNELLKYFNEYLYWYLINNVYWLILFYLL